MFTMVSQLLFFPKQFEDNWASGLWCFGVQVLSNYLPDSDAKSLWSFLQCFSCNDSLDVLYVDTIT